MRAVIRVAVGTQQLHKLTQRRSGRPVVRLDRRAARHCMVQLLKHMRRQALVCEQQFLRALCDNSREVGVSQHRGRLAYNDKPVAKVLDPHARTRQKLRIFQYGGVLLWGQTGVKSSCRSSPGPAAAKRL